MAKITTGEEPTGEISLTFDNVKCLMVAIADSIHKFNTLTSMPIEDFQQSFPGMDLETAKAYREEIKESGEFLVENYQEILPSLRELSAELESMQDAHLKNKIVGLDKKPLN